MNEIKSQDDSLNKPSESGQLTSNDSTQAEDTESKVSSDRLNRTFRAPHTHWDPPMLSQLEAYNLARTTIRELYNAESGRKFIHHLIYAFNIEAPSFILLNKRTLIDCLTRSKLNSVSTNEMPVPVEIRNLYSQLVNLTDESLKVQMKSELDQIIEKYVLDNSLTRVAIRSNYTNKIIGIEELQALDEFISSEIESGNHVISQMMLYLRPSEYKSERKKFYDGQVQKSKLTDDQFKSKMKNLKHKLDNE